ncbi:TetR/AcrR family transcriptional regulator, partial [Pectobacterium carotovorum subsp. carotovorum]|nr:TetR/AcrR family transcriptional regulator [Pectobacterium carotovorum subsp. carotovorum]
RLIISDKDRETIIRCMEIIGKIYETGIIALMQKVFMGE